MITPPINPQGDRLLLRDENVALIGKLSAKRAEAALEQARATVRVRLEPWLSNNRNLDGTPRPPPDGVPQSAYFVDVEQLVDVVLDVVQTAVLTDRARQREVLREVQAHLPACASVGEAPPAAPPKPPAGDPRPFAERADVERKSSGG